MTFVVLVDLNKILIKRQTFLKNESMIYLKSQNTFVKLMHIYIHVYVFENDESYSVQRCLINTFQCTCSRKFPLNH